MVHIVELALGVPESRGRHLRLAAQLAFGGGRVEVGDVFLNTQGLDGLAGREFRWGGGLARRERGRRVVGH